MVSTFRQVLLGVAVVIGVAQTAVGNSSGSLRARRWHGVQDSNGGGGLGAKVWHHEHQSLVSLRDPQCNMPEAMPCTLNTTAIGMLERGYATYYDEDCVGNEGLQGCFTDDVPQCRTCYLSLEIYMDAFNATEASRPEWPMCPCCVPTTLEDNHIDIEVKAFNYTLFGISEVDCTDPPTPAPGLGNSTSETTPEPTVAGTTPPPTVAETTLEPTAASTTPAPTNGSRGGLSDDDEFAPSPVAPNPTPTPEDVGSRSVETSDSAEGLSTGAKIGIGAGSAVGVIILGAAGFGIMKASGRT